MGRSPRAASTTPEFSLPEIPSVGGTAGERVFEPLRSFQQEGPQALESLASGFYEAAGAPVVPSEVVDPETLRLALAPPGTPGQEEAYGQTQNWLQAQYTGPQGFDPEAFSGIQQDINQLQGYVSGLATGQALPTAISQATPGLTPGEARYEAERLVSPEYFQETQGFESALEELGREAEREARQAERYARQREGQEERVRGRAQRLLEARQGRILESAGERLAERQGQAQAQRDLYSQALEALSQGQPLPAGIPGAEGFQTQAQELVGTAREAAQDIMSQYPNLEPGTGELFMTGKGDLRVRFPDWLVERYPELQGQVFSVGPSEWTSGRMAEYPPEVRDFIEREWALQSLFLPGEFEWSGGGFQREPGAPDYSAVNPLYFGAALELPPVENYLTFQQAQGLNLAAATTAEQRRVYNAIAGLLGQARTLQEAGQPYQAAQIMADVGGYIQDEREALARQERDLTERERDWQRRMDDAYDRWEEENSSWFGGFFG